MSNTFKPGDIVNASSRSEGTVYAIACKAATKAGGRTCSPDKCTHDDKGFVWVKWKDGTICSYNYEALKLSSSDTTKTEDKEMSKFKDTIQAKSSVDWKAYNGFTTVKVDRQGRPYLKESLSAENTSPPIKETDIDWDAYAGYKRGSYRKSKKSEGEALSIKGL